MDKYDLLPRQLLHEGTVDQSYFFEPVKMKDEQVFFNRSKNTELSPTNFKSMFKKPVLNRMSVIVIPERMSSIGTFACGIPLNISRNNSSSSKFKSPPLNKMLEASTAFSNSC